MGQFIKTSFAFALGFLMVLAVTEWFLGRRMAALHGKPSLSPETYLAIERASEPSDSVGIIYLGDSVAHQLFPPGSERKPDERYLTFNQAGSLAAQYYVLSDAVRSFPNLRDVYLLYYPGSFENDLGPPFANDYFCGFFHTPGEMREVFGVKRDFHLLLVQIGRELLPNILATNSVNRPLALPTENPYVSAGTATSGSGTEPLVDLLNSIYGSEPAEEPPLVSEKGQLVDLSRVSKHYLARMRRLCSVHGITFHVLPCPCSDERPFDDANHVYDGPIIYRPAVQFGDRIHVRQEFRASVRRELETDYGLPTGQPARAVSH